MRKMTPIDNRVYNALIEWIRKSNVDIVGISTDSRNKRITVYTDKPGHLVGKAGCNIHSCEKAIADSYFYKGYTILLQPVEFFVTCKDKPVSDKRYVRECAQYLNSFFNTED